jgi:sulfur-oxidizing protein SoxY
MAHSRRTFLQHLLKAGLAVAATGSLLVARIASAAAEARPAFTATKLEEAYKALGVGTPVVSTDIAFKAPDIAENGAAVPVEIESRVPGTRSIAILVEKNPHVMSAQFSFPEGTEPFVATRVKVAESSLIHAIVTTDAGSFTASRLVKVTLGGCGG